MIERQFRDFLRTHGPLTAMVPETHIFGPSAIGVEDNYITIHLIGKPRGQFGARSSRVQISIFNKVYGDAKDIANIIEEALTDFTGGFAKFPDNQLDLYEQETEFHHIVVDVVVYEQVKTIYNE